MHSVGEGLAAKQLLEHHNNVPMSLPLTNNNVSFNNDYNYNYVISDDDSSNRYIMTTANNNINTDSFNTIHYNNNNTTTLSINQNHDQIKLIKSTTTSLSSLNGQSIDCKFFGICDCLLCFSPFLFCFGTSNIYRFCLYFCTITHIELSFQYTRVAHSNF